MSIGDNPSGIGLTVAEHSAALARELAKPEPLPPMPLYRIAAELQELLELREDAEAQGALPEELAAIEERIKQYALAEVKKVDGIAHAVSACNAFAEECEKEAARLTAMAKRHRNRLERIKAAALWAMQTLGIRRLDTPTNKLRVQANGGVEPLEVYDLSEVPRDLKQVTVTLPMRIWHEFQIAIAKGDYMYPGSVLPPAKVEVQQDAIRAELKKRVPCPECITSMGRRKDGPGPCPRCEGYGTVPASVPGARLLPRGSHLRVE